MYTKGSQVFSGKKHFVTFQHLFRKQNPRRPHLKTARVCLHHLSPNTAVTVKSAMDSAPVTMRFPQRSQA